MWQLLNSLDRLPGPVIGLLGFLGVALVGATDFITGPGISVAVFYMLPIGLVAWTGRRSLAVFVALAAAAAWLYADRSGGGLFGHDFVPYWNALVRLAMFLIVVYLLSALRSLVEEEARRGRVDPLTGLLNRRSFEEAFSREIERARRYHRCFTAAYIDLDNFKAVNDIHGHAEGDALLRRVGEVIANHVRETDIASRLGGDEFAVVFIEADAVSGRRAAEDLRVALEGGQSGLAAAVTFSIGAVSFNQPPLNAEEALRMVDTVMYGVKRSGKHAVHHQSWPPAAAP